MRKIKSKKKKKITLETFKQIFIDHWEEFTSTHSRYNTKDYNEIIEKMINCGNPDKMGYAGWRCLNCGDYHKVSMTCKCAFCLSCAVPYTDRWMEFISRRLIPGVTYKHLVLTTPDHLRIYFYRNRELLSPFMRLAHLLLQDVFQQMFKIKLDIGLIVVLQTFGRPGCYNVHLHILFTAGGITPQNSWKKITYIPYELIRKKWQYHLLTFLRNEMPYSKDLRKDINKAWHGNRNGFVIHIQKGEVPAGGKGLAKYLAKYLVSPPISVNRITDYDGSSVSYKYKDHKTKKMEFVSIPVMKFIGRMVQHIMPKGFQRIRYYGFHSHVRYEKMRNIIRLIQPAGKNDDYGANSYRVIPRKSFKELSLSTFGKDPLICPKCGTQMQLECLWHPQYGMFKDDIHTPQYLDTG